MSSYQIYVFSELDVVKLLNGLKIKKKLDNRIGSNVFVATLHRVQFELSIIGLNSSALVTQVQL